MVQAERRALGGGHPPGSGLPAAVRVYREGMLLQHAVMLDDGAVSAVADAIARLHQHRHALARRAVSGSL